MPRERCHLTQSHVIRQNTLSAEVRQVLCPISKPGFQTYLTELVLFFKLLFISIQQSLGSPWDSTETLTCQSSSMKGRQQTRNQRGGNDWTGKGGRGRMGGVMKISWRSSRSVVLLTGSPFSDLSGYKHNNRHCNMNIKHQSQLFSCKLVQILEQKEQPCNDMSRKS